MEIHHPVIIMPKTAYSSNRLAASRDPSGYLLPQTSDMIPPFSLSASCDRVPERPERPDRVYFPTLAKIAAHCIADFHGQTSLVSAKWPTLGFGLQMKMFILLERIDSAELSSTCVFHTTFGRPVSIVRMMIVSPCISSILWSLWGGGEGFVSLEYDRAMAARR